jgi:hypothetical protein
MPSGPALWRRPANDHRGRPIRAGNCFAYGELPVVLGENLHTPWPHPPRGAERRNEAVQVEGPLSTKASAVSGISTGS